MVSNRRLFWTVVTRKFEGDGHFFTTTKVNYTVPAFCSGKNVHIVMKPV